MPDPSEPTASSVSAPAPWLSRLLAYRRLLVIAAIVLIAVIRDFFYIVHVGNTGAAWSMFSGQSVLLAIFALVTLAAIVIWRHALGLRERRSQLCFGLLCGGGVGNVIDRLAYGHVVDFIDLHFGSYVYPTFNVADSGICVGVVFYLWHSLREPK